MYRFQILLALAILSFLDRLVVMVGGVDGDDDLLCSSRVKLLIHLVEAWLEDGL